MNTKPKFIVPINEGNVPMQNLTFRIKPHQFKKLTDVSKKTGQETATIVRMALDFALKHLEIEEVENE